MDEDAEAWGGEAAVQGHRLTSGRAAWGPRGLIPELPLGLRAQPCCQVRAVLPLPLSAHRFRRLLSASSAGGGHTAPSSPEGKLSWSSSLHAIPGFSFMGWNTCPPTQIHPQIDQECHRILASCLVNT